MKITRKIRNIAKYLSHIANKETFYIGVPASSNYLESVHNLGFSVPVASGERILPAADFGPATERNADGYMVIHRDQPMETAYRQREWTWKEFRGRYDYQEKSKIVEIPYSRYPRTHIPPYAVHLEVLQNGIGEGLIVAGPFMKEEVQYERAMNTVNMLVEIFGDCIVFNKDLFAWKKAPLRQLNWELLPPGKNPWESAKSALDKIILRAETGNQPVIRARFDAVGKYEPEFIAVGRAGFNGYVIFGFPSRGFCILESQAVNNATYVLKNETFETVSALSKAEILHANAHLARLIHRKGWFGTLDILFRRRAA